MRISSPTLAGRASGTRQLAPSADSTVAMSPSACVAHNTLQQIRFADESCNERRAWILVHLCRRSDLDDASRRHDGDAVAHRERFFLVVRHQHERDAERAIELAQLQLHFLAKLKIEVRRAARRGAGSAARVRARARAQHALARWPPESSAGRRSANVATSRRTSSSAPSVRRAESLGLRHTALLESERDVSRHGEVRKERVVLEDHADRPLIRAHAPLTTSPSIRIVPPSGSGSSKPAINRSVVVLPHPDGPSSEKNSPRPISSETWSTAGTPRKCRETRSRETTGIEVTVTKNYRAPTLRASLAARFAQCRDRFRSPRRSNLTTPCSRRSSRPAWHSSPLSSPAACTSAGWPGGQPRGGLYVLPPRRHHRLSPHRGPDLALLAPERLRRGRVDDSFGGTRLLARRAMAPPLSRAGNSAGDLGLDRDSPDRASVP